MKAQNGFTLLEMMLVIALMAVGTLMSLYDKKTDLEHVRAKEIGGELFTYNNAVRAWVSANPGAPNSVHQGSKWLKATTCGGSSAKAYLPCEFPDATITAPFSFGRLSIESTVETTGTVPNSKTIVTTTTTPFMVGKDMRSDLSGLAAIVAAAGGTGSSTPILMATQGKFTSAPDSGIISMTAGSDASTDAWLRTDGSNTMNNNLTFNPANPAPLRQLLNVSRIQALSSEIFYLGNPGGAAANHAVVVEANESLLGSLVISNQAGAPSGIEVSRGNVEVRGGYVNAAVFYDADNTAYRIDPNNTTVLNALNTTGTVNVGGSLGVSGTALVNGALGVNGRVTTNEYIQLNAAVGEGWGCSPNGLISRDPSGKILSCTNGIWSSSKPNIVRGPLVYSPIATDGSVAVSSCPANSTLILCDQKTASQYGRFPTDYEVDWSFNFEVNDENETTASNITVTDAGNNQCLAFTRSYNQSDGTMIHRSRAQAVCVQ